MLIKLKDLKKMIRESCLKMRDFSHEDQTIMDRIATGISKHSQEKQEDEEMDQHLSPKPEDEEIKLTIKGQDQQQSHHVQVDPYNKDTSILPRLTQLRV